MLPDKNECYGCMACINVCTQKAVVMDRDSFGCWYARIDSDKCVKCKCCTNVCPVSSKIVKKKEDGFPKVYSAIAKDEKQRLSSTSGGIFSLLADSVISSGGSVAGAAYEKNFQVKHIIVHTKEDADKLKQSKYVQSTTGTIYRKVKDELENGRTVLFSGTPCQIEALYLFLGKNRQDKNLITCEVICVGVPMPKIFLDYLRTLMKRYKSTPSKVWFKNKENGWESLSTRIDFKNGEIYQADKESDLYMKGFRQYGFFVRPSCFHCRLKGVSRTADITLGDFWQLKHTQFNDNKGISLILLNTQKGEQLFKSIESQIWSERRLLKEAMRNEGLMHNMECSWMIKAFRLMYGKLPLSLIIQIADIITKVKVIIRILLYQNDKKGGFE